MEFIYHLLPQTCWEPQGPGPYRADSLAREGFIHCSYHDQVARIANAFYESQTDLLVLCIDLARLSSPVHVEDAGTGELFPHVHGPIDWEAIVTVRRLQRGPDQRWVFRAPATEAWKSP